MLVHRHRRWANIEATMVHCLEYAVRVSSSTISMVPAMSVDLTLMYTSLLALLFSRIHGSHEFIDISIPMDFLANLILDFTCRRHNLPCKMSEADLKSGHIYSKPFHVANCEALWLVDPLILPNCQLLSIFIHFKLK